MMMGKACLLIAFMLLLINHTSLSLLTCKRPEHEALLKFRHSFTEDAQGLLSTWVGDECCHWSGVTCDNVTGNVIKLKLRNRPSHNGLYETSLVSAELSSALLGLSFLRHLDLSFNYFNHSQIPEFLGSMKHLRYLNLATAGFTGPLPPQLGNLTNLIHLDLSGETAFLSYFGTLGDNKIEGSLPSSLGQLTNLKYLDLGYTEINGGLPSSLGQLTNLEYLDLAGYTEIKDGLPSWFGQLTNLKHLDLVFNNINGSLPFGLRQLTNLKYLDLGYNKLHGGLPNWLGKLTNLKHLDLSHNNWLQGQVPASLANLSALKYLDLSDNRLSGAIANVLGNLTSIEHLDISSNSFQGELPKWILNMRSIFTLKLAENKLTGSLPRHRACDDCNLWLLDLHNNKLSGAIPPWLGHLQDMEILDLSNNSLSGVIFEGENALSFLSGMNSLVLLDLSYNRLSGEIPIKNNVNASLQFLRLRGNNFSGVISSQMCNFRHLVILDLAQNHLTGHIPRCLGSLTFINDVIYSSDTGVEIQEVVKGLFERVYGTDGIYTAIDLSSNGLVGMIPEELTNITKLKELNLSNNHLTGSIPGDIGNLQSLESLDLSNNNLSGTIPQSLSALPWISKLNLSNNNFHGLIPTGRQLQTLPDPSIYAGNPGLYGFPLQNYSTKLNPPSSPTNDDPGAEEDTREKMWFYLVILSGIATGFWGVVGTLVLKKSWRHSYFRFIEETADKIYVPLKVRANRFRNKTR